MTVGLTVICIQKIFYDFKQSSLFYKEFSNFSKIEKNIKKRKNGNKFTEYEIKYVGLYEEFDGICLSSDEGCRKPSSKFFDVVFDRYDLKKEESVMIGNDWTTDIEGANVYGIDSVYLHTEISPRDTILEKVNATYVYPDGKLSNLKKLV